MLIFDYVDSRNYKYSGGFFGTDNWQIGHVTGGTKVADVSVGAPIAAKKDYLVDLYVTATSVTLTVDGVAQAVFDYGESITDGEVGLGTHNAVARFDNFSAEAFAGSLPGAVVPYYEDFEDGVADGLAEVSGNWLVTGGQYEVTPAVGTNGLSTLHQFSTGHPALKVSATLNSAAAGSGYSSNALVIFDYQSPMDFKYAGTFFASNQWRIGHYDGSMNTVASATQNITTGTDYDLKVSVNGTAVQLLVGGASKVTHDFGAALSVGQVGVGTNNAVARFDNLAVQASGGS